MLPLRDRLPTRRLPVVNYLLLAANVLAFLWERAMLAQGYPPARLLADFGLVPALVTHAPLQYGITVFTSMFLHDPTGWLHLGGNMLFLWIFGDNVEEAMGHVRYAVFYVLAGVAAAAAQVAMAPFSDVPMVGASGAIAGVLAAYGSLYPRAPVTVLNPIPLLWLVFGITLELPAWIVILEFFVMNLIHGLGSATQPGQGGVAFFAHLGGFVAGLVLVRLFVAGRPARTYDPWSGLRSPSRRPRPPPPRDYWTR